MKNLILILLAVSLSACSRSHSAQGNGVIGQPSSPVPGVVAPVNTKIATYTKGAAECSIWSFGGVECTDGFATGYVPGLDSVVFSKIVLSASIGCALSEASGPATNNQLYCWNMADFTPALIDQGPQIGYAAPTYLTGARDLVDDSAGGQMCITVGIYDASNVFQQDMVSCGTSVDATGFVQ